MARCVSNISYALHLQHSWACTHVCIRRMRRLPPLRHEPPDIFGLQRARVLCLSPCEHHSHAVIVGTSGVSKHPTHQNLATHARRSACMHLCACMCIKCTHSCMHANAPRHAEHLVINNVLSMVVGGSYLADMGGPPCVAKAGFGSQNSGRFTSPHPDHSAALCQTATQQV